MQLFQDCLNLTWGRENQVVTFCLERLADTRRRHTLGCAPTWPAVCLSHEQKSREKLALHKALLCLGDLFIAHGDDGTAHTLFTVALHGFTRIHRRPSLGDLARMNRNFHMLRSFGQWLVHVLNGRPKPLHKSMQDLWVAFQRFRRKSFPESIQSRLTSSKLRRGWSR
jgi:hypothetical protein